MCCEDFEICCEDFEMCCEDFEMCCEDFRNCSEFKMCFEEFGMCFEEFGIFIAKIRHYVPRRVLLSVYNSLIVPYFTYGICGKLCLDISTKDRNSTKTGLTSHLLQ